MFSWQLRNAVLCDRYLSFSKLENDTQEVIDYIPLHEIHSVSIQVCG